MGAYLCNVLLKVTKSGVSQFLYFDNPLGNPELMPLPSPTSAAPHLVANHLYQHHGVLTASYFRLCILTKILLICSMLV